MFLVLSLSTETMGTNKGLDEKKLAKQLHPEMIYGLLRGYKLHKLKQVSRDFCLHVYSVHFNV